MKIPPETTKIHGISDDDVKHAELFKEHVDNISKLIDRSILVGHNIERFDWPFLKMEYLRCGAEIPEPYAIIDTWILAKKFKNFKEVWGLYVINLELHLKRPILLMLMLGPL